jgi:hypothetical protein
MVPRAMTTQPKSLRNSSLNARFIQVMEGLGHTGYSFSKILGTSEAVISNIRKEKNPPNVQLIQRLLNKYEEIDPEWLLSGRGRMLRINQAGKPEELPSEAVMILRRLDDRVKSLEGLLKNSVKNQLDRIAIVDETLNDVQDQIAHLERNEGKVKKDPRRTA